MLRCQQVTIWRFKVSYQVVVTFDLVAADKYKCVKDELANIGLYDYVETEDGIEELPENVFTGEVDLSNAEETVLEITEAVEGIFEHCGVTGKSFVAAGGTDFASGVGE